MISMCGIKIYDYITHIKGKHLKVSIDLYEFI